jgi:hypothetical protein
MARTVIIVFCILHFLVTGLDTATISPTLQGAVIEKGCLLHFTNT